MNSFGVCFRVSVFGESHGEVVGVTVDGCPAGVSLQPSDFYDDIQRRKPFGVAGTARREQDVPRIVSGVFNGKTTGAPLTVLFENEDVDSDAYAKFADIPRPGHADFTAFKKFGGYNDYRGGGHFSGRLTLPLVAAGVVAKKIIPSINIVSRVTTVGGVTEWKEKLHDTAKKGDSLGGVVETVVDGVPIGVGEPFFDSVESLISHAVFAIPGVKGIEFGLGFAAASLRGSEVNDSLISPDGTTASNHAGGINGGISNGNRIVFRVAVKPTSSISLPQRSVNVKSGKQVDVTVSGRHDAAFVLRTPVVLEAVTAIVFADLVGRISTLSSLGAE